MPIINLTVIDGENPGNPGRLGILRKGGAKPANGIGPNLKHFRFDPDGDDELADLFEQAYGANPVSIGPIYLPYQTADECFETWREEYGTGALKHRCDGETLWQRDGRNRLYKTNIPCPGGCKPKGRLYVILPDLMKLSGRVGLTTVTTGSKWDLTNVMKALVFYERMGGSLKGIPFRLYRKPSMISTPGSGGQRYRREEWLIHIDAAQEWVSRQLEASRQYALTGGVSLPALPAPVEYEDEDEEASEPEEENEGDYVDASTGEIINTEFVIALDDAEALGLQITDMYGEDKIKELRLHIKVWTRFIEIVVPAAIEVKAVKEVDISKYAALPYDKLVEAAQKAVQVSKNKMLTDLGKEAPGQEAALEVWLEKWRAIFTREPDF